MTTLYEGAFAKLNLTLDVLGKRPDGYHDLQSVMQTISLRDDIEIDVGTGKPWTLSCDQAGIPCDERNLAWKAAKVYLDAIGKDPDGIAIRITKRIPSQAGMGGGSADAAAGYPGWAGGSFPPGCQWRFPEFLLIPPGEKTHQMPSSSSIPSWNSSFSRSVLPSK